MYSLTYPSRISEWLVPPGIGGTGGGAHRLRFSFLMCIYIVYVRNHANNHVCKQQAEGERFKNGEHDVREHWRGNMGAWNEAMHMVTAEGGMRLADVRPRKANTRLTKNMLLY